jgi:hypothetical protein
MPSKKGIPFLAPTGVAGSIPDRVVGEKRCFANRQPVHTNWNLKGIGAKELP